MFKRLTIELVGSSADKRDVRLDDFIAQLQTVKKALRETEIAVSGNDEPALDYRVVDLRHSSPSTVVLEPISLNGALPPELIADVLKTFTAELRLIKREGRLLTEPDLARLQAYQDLGVKTNNRIETVKIRSGRTVVTIDEKFKRKLASIVGPDEFVHGTISGMLEAVNFHNTNRFVVFPVLGPKRVVGQFPMNLRPKIKEAIGNYVTVFGKLRYKAWSDYPHGVIAEDVDIHEAESDLPTLTKLRGAFTGELGPPHTHMNSAEFIDKLRDEEW
jgi:hypothetical protein